MTIFEKIINKEIPAYIVYEDHLALAFLDISQATKGHTLVVPKKPYKDIFEIPEDLLMHLIMISKKIAIATNKAFNPDGINILNNNKESAGQTVFHFHIHVIPRYNNDSIKFNFENNSNKTTKIEYEERANAIRVAL